jgi:hypothetical protein
MREKNSDEAHLEPEIYQTIKNTNCRKAQLTKL